MKKSWVIMTVALFACLGVLHASDNPTMGDFRTAMAGMKRIMVYSYDSETSVVFPNGDKDRQKNSLFMDIPGKRFLMKSDDELLLLAGGWAYKASHDHKVVTLYNAQKYNERYQDYLPELEAIFDQSMMSVFIDSVVLKQGRLLSSKREGKLSTFVLGFPEGSYLKGLTLVYNTATKLPERLVIKTLYVDASGRQTAYEIACRNYKRAVPDEVFNTDQYFLIRSGKPVLQQFKNYKISSLL